MTNPVSHRFLATLLLLELAKPVSHFDPFNCPFPSFPSTSPLISSAERWLSYLECVCFAVAYGRLLQISQGQAVSIQVWLALGFPYYELTRTTVSVFFFLLLLLSLCTVF